MHHIDQTHEWEHSLTHGVVIKNFEFRAITYY